MILEYILFNRVSFYLTVLAYRFIFFVGTILYNFSLCNCFRRFYRWVKETYIFYKNIICTITLFVVYTYKFAKTFNTYIENILNEEKNGYEIINPIILTENKNECFNKKQ